MTKTISILTLVFLSFGLTNPVEQKAKDNVIVETITQDLNNDNIPDTIRLTTPPVTGDPGEFQKMHLILSGNIPQTYSANDVWGRIDKDFLVKNQNAVGSNRVFVYRDSSQVLILMFGFMYGSGRSEFSIIQIKNNKAKRIFDEGLDHIMELRDFNNDNKVELLGRNGYEIYQSVDSLNADIGSYSPYLVYTINDSCELNKPLTKKYNEEHFVFAGYEWSEKIKVLYPRDNGRPRIID